MTLPSEPIGSIPRPHELQVAMQAAADGRIADDELAALFDAAVVDTLQRFAETGSPVVTDGEQRKPSFATYPIAGLTDLDPGGVTIPFADGHTRQLPCLTAVRSVTPPRRGRISTRPASTPRPSSSRASSRRRH